MRISSLLGNEKCMQEHPALIDINDHPALNEVMSCFLAFAPATGSARESPT
jgi:hypothetical protein